MNEETLFIPRGISTEIEVLPGFNSRHFKTFLLMCLPGIVFGVAVGSFTGMITGFLIFGIGGGISYFANRKFDTGESPVELILSLLRFKKSQKYYPYVCNKNLS
jgi:hypothetical protein